MENKGLVTGCVVEKNDKWYCVLSYKENNKRKQKWIATGISSKRGGKTEAKAILAKEVEKFEELLNAKNKSSFDGQDMLSDCTGYELFTDYLLKYLNYRSVNNPTKKKLSEVVIMGYRYYVKHLQTFLEANNLKPRLNDINSNIFNQFYFYLKEGKKLKCMSITKYHCLFQGAIKEALDRGLIAKDPLKNVNREFLHKEPTKTIRFNDEEAKEFLRLLHEKNHKFELAYNVALRLGLRRSEILGLAFDCIDFENKVLMVRRSVLNFYGRNQISCTKIENYKLKTESSQRDIPIPDDLLDMFKKQKEWIENNKKTFGNGYDSNYKNWGLDMVFVNETGKLYNPDFVSKQLTKFEKENNLKKVGLHGLRRSCGSIMYRNGVNIKVIQRLLGHSDYATTMDIYVDVDEDDLIGGIEVLDTKLLKQAKEKIDQERDGDGDELADQAKFVKVARDMIMPE